MTLIGNIGNLSRRVSDALDAVISILGLDIVTGFLRTEYDDVFPGGPFVTPTGASAPDDVTITVEGVPLRYKAFDGGNTAELMSNTFEFVHGIDIEAINAGTLKLEGHVHTMPSTTGAGTAIFNLDMVYIPSTPAAQVAMTSIAIPCVYDANHQYWHHIAGAEITVPAGGFEIGGIIGSNIRRTPTATASKHPPKNASPTPNGPAQAKSPRQPSKPHI
jgi:hypothetical protein